MSGHHFEVVVIESDQLEKFHVRPRCGG
jgi:hypothetical protein